MKRFKPVLVGATLGLAVVGNAAAAIENGDFANGLAGWSVLGDVGVQSNAALLTTASLTFEDDFPAVAGAFNFSGTSAANVGFVGGVEDFVGVPIGGLDPDAGNGIAAYEGSALKQSFTTNLTVLSFNWNFLSNDIAGDYAFFVIDGVSHRLASASEATRSSTTFARETGISSTDVVLFPGANHVVSFGVVDVGDYNATSALRVWDVQIAVPEPETYALMLAGLGLLGAIAYRRRAS